MSEQLELQSTGDFDIKSIETSPSNGRRVLLENRIEWIVALNHNVFNESEAAIYCRCSSDSIRYHALRSRKLIFCDFSREGLVFLKQDLDSFLQSSRKKNHRG